MMIITQPVPLLLPVTEVECFCIESNSEHETRHGLTQLKIAMCAYLHSRGTIEQTLNFFDISEIMSSSEADEDDAVPVGEDSDSDQLSLPDELRCLILHMLICKISAQDRQLSCKEK